MHELNEFLRTQTIIQIAPAAGEPWIANVLMCCEDASKLYFIGSKERLYGQQLKENPKLAFASAWHAENNHLDRKGIQGVGEAHEATEAEEIALGVSLHNRDYPEFKERITPEWIETNEHGSVVWVITPTFIQFWNDELYGPDGSKGFNF